MTLYQFRKKEDFETKIMTLKEFHHKLNTPLALVDSFDATNENPYYTVVINDYQIHVEKFLSQLFQEVNSFCLNLLFLKFLFEINSFLLLHHLIMFLDLEFLLIISDK